MDLAEQILEAIQYGIDKAIQPFKRQDIIAVVKQIESDRYIVSIDGKDYKLYNGVGIHLSVGDTVWVHAPNSDMKKAYICAKANGNA